MSYRTEASSEISVRSASGSVQASVKQDRHLVPDHNPVLRLGQYGRPTDDSVGVHLFVTRLWICANRPLSQRSPPLPTVHLDEIRHNPLNNPRTSPTCVGSR
ncbi:hypothetical protein KC19_12G147400 [Ceratodon purpureus]|uniref:Uncharacterized protein n=1 Tax=Ceratodon purpureus TaxID=3225 RepID=A0A8T0G9J8_CERPU|nr:hypothetical protein KC19_12G147400 [Ceratodon purpureus]